MDEKSLIRAKEIVINALHNSDIKAVDRLELIINVAAFLDHKSYENSIKVLKLENKPKRR